MADTPAFTALCEALESASDLDRLEARGTIRLALKNAGLEAGTVSATQLDVVIDKILPSELEARGVAVAICAELHGALAGLDATATPEGPEAVFSRLGG